MGSDKQKNKKSSLKYVEKSEYDEIIRSLHFCAYLDKELSKCLKAWAEDPMAACKERKQRAEMLRIELAKKV